MADILRDLDFFNLDDLLTDEQRMARDTAKRFVDREILPLIERSFASETFPMHLVPQMAELGMFGANLKGYGCAGMDNVAYGLIMQELEAGDSGLRSFASVQSALSMYAIYANGSEEQKQRYLPEMAKGKLIGCFGLTEPDHGSDPGGMETRARRDGDGWILNGTKRWITNGSIADVAIVWAKVEEGITGFLVEKGTPGFSTRDIHGKFSMRASITSELILEDVRIPKTAHLEKARGLKGPLGCLTQARYGIAWGAIWRGAIVFPLRARLHQIAQAVLASARGLSTGAGQAGEDADRDHQGANGLPAARASEGRGQDAPRARVVRQAQQRQRGAENRARRRATCWAPTASSTSTRSSATC